MNFVQGDERGTTSRVGKETVDEVQGQSQQPNQVMSSTECESSHQAELGTNVNISPLELPPDMTIQSEVIPQLERVSDRATKRALRATLVDPTMAIRTAVIKKKVRIQLAS